ncbi:hypothetical protein C8J57DRAFT_1239952 [Mycena rebaudengoi]|nr:hypothetical protein C8J57DRAFT_1239952 [Mycena rebaudengoi]
MFNPKSIVFVFGLLAMVAAAPVAEQERGVAAPEMCELEDEKDKYILEFGCLMLEGYLASSSLFDAWKRWGFERQKLLVTQANPSIFLSRCSTSMEAKNEKQKIFGSIIFPVSRDRAS